MGATGIVRRMDELGRIILPKEIRKIYQLKEGDPVEIFTDSEGIILRKYNPFTSYLDQLSEMEAYIKDDPDMKRELMKTLLGDIQTMKDRFRGDTQ